MPVPDPASAGEDGPSPLLDASSSPLQLKLTPPLCSALSRSTENLLDAGVSEAPAVGNIFPGTDGSLYAYVASQSTHPLIEARLHVG